MELDKRIIEGKTYLDCFDTEIAKQFIGKKGYFSHYIDNYADLKNTVLGTLGSTGDTFHESFCCTEQPFDNYYYEFFIPEDWVKEPEKKWRAYTSIEFAEKFGLWIGHVIRIRDRPENAGQKYEYKIMFVGYRWYKGMFEVFINGCWIDLLTLFELYEYIEDGEWHKFGVEE